jgi:hypothetical protein
MEIPSLAGLSPRDLVGLRLSRSGNDVGAVAADLPPPTMSVDGYEDALFGFDAMTLIAKSIENGEVLSSTNRQHLYETLPGGRAFHTRRWWFDWQRTVEKQVIGEGLWNQASLVRGAALPPAEFFSSGYGVRVPSKGMIIRTGKKPTTKTAVIREMITAAYAHANGFGPVIYAQFYYGTQKDVALLMRAPQPAGPWDGAVPAFQPLRPPGGQLGSAKAAFTCAVAEAWEGDCKKKISSVPADAADQFLPYTFAREFVELCMRAADAGFWHMDIKRANMLYRTDTRPLELCFTDFDGYFCRIMSPEIRVATRRCCIAATAACMLGEIRCHEAMEVWARYAPEVKRAMKDLAGVDLDNIDPQEWCFFLRNVGEKRSVAINGRSRMLDEDSLTEEERVLGGRFRNHLFNYFMDSGDGDTAGSCFKFEDKKPLFPQIVEFAFA